ncbi:MAG: 4-vinyl reductase, partial [Anaerolineales bacterium]|nr:4-vinyl reductase [Anaerolineales bacterium]
MTDSVESTYYYPNNMGRIILLSMEEILGHNGLKAVLNQSNLSHLINNYPPNNLDLQFKFENLSKIQVALVELHGPNGGRGLALRTGRACFKYGLQEYGPILGLTDL